jgi:electron transport complex protein RnfD
VLLAFVCPVTIPLWTIIIGDFFAIIVVKMIFGGIGRNIVNPALAGRAFMFSYPALMTHWIKPGLQNIIDFTGVDAETTATPLYHMGQGVLPQDGILDMFLGNIGGCLGETSALLLLIGLVYLLIRKIISLRIPVAFIGTVVVLTYLFPQGGQDRVTWMAAQILSGGLMLGAIFMATDYVTSPITKLGQVIYGIGCGVLTVVIRYFGGYPEGVSYAILIMNCCVVLLDRIGRPKKFGSVKKEVAAK